MPHAESTPARRSPWLIAGLAGLATLLLSSVTLPVAADELLLEGIRKAPPNDTAGMPRPSRGMPMEDVEAAFGAPDHRHAPVGDPPITRWDYPGFVVYFEHRRVLHSVVRRSDG